MAILAAGEPGLKLTAEEEQELVAALQDVRSGNYEDGIELLRELRRR